MKIYTSSWFTYKGPGRIGISRGTPRFGVPAGYRLYKQLAPSRDILQNTQGKHDYEPRFRREILEPLDPNLVVADLQRLAGDHPPVLLCFERPPFDDVNFCHRHMVSAWLNEHTSAVVVEWDEKLHGAQGALL